MYILVQGLQRIKTVWKRLHKRNRQATNRCKPTVFTCFGPWVQTSKPDLPVSAPATKDPFIFWYLLQCLANIPCLPYLRLDPPSDHPFAKPCWCAGSRKWRLRTAAAMGTWSFARRATFSLSSGISSNLGNKKWLHKVLNVLNHLATFFSFFFDDSSTLPTIQLKNGILSKIITGITQLSRFGGICFLNMSTKKRICKMYLYMYLYKYKYLYLYDLICTCTVYECVCNCMHT